MAAATANGAAAASDAAVAGDASYFPPDTPRRARSVSSAGRSIKNHILCEVAWEVANKVGGIYTVIKTKAPVTCQEYGDRYLLIGPLSYKSAPMEVEAIEPEAPELAQTLAAMRERGVKLLYGRWLIEGGPRVLLFDTGSCMNRLDEWKTDLWNVAGIPTPPNDSETNDTIVFGYLVAWFLGEFSARERSRAIVAHFHEWLAGLAIPLCRKRHIDVTTVFTTHATLLGRYLCAGSVDFYNNLAYFDVDHEAGRRGIYHRYCIERAATHCADVFTTVSHITAYESEHLLKRKPDGVLPNGLNVVKFSAMHEFQNLHAQAKQKINDFVRGHFYGHYDFDLDNTLYFFTAGRYEYRNKGVDMFIESLARLNGRLQQANSKMTVVAFIIMPAATNSYTIEALKGQAVTKQLRDTVTEIQNRIGQRLFERTARYNGEAGTEVPDADSLLSAEDKILLKRRVFALRRNALPPVTTHNMADDANDPILNQIRRVQLFNRPQDRVKIVFHPEFLNANNPILGLDYEEFVRGCHLGVFPSYYEPWGYTPAECTVMGVPSITTNLSGFGCFMDELIENGEDYGIYIVDRRMKSVEDSVNQLAEQMFSFATKSRRQRINQRNRTERLSDLLDWKRMGLEYSKARQLALRRAYPDSFGEDDFDFETGSVKISRPLSAPGSPSLRSGMRTPGDYATLTEEMEQLGTSDFYGTVNDADDKDDQYPFPLHTILKKRPQGLASGQTTPGSTHGANGGLDLDSADRALLKSAHAPAALAGRPALAQSTSTNRAPGAAAGTARTRVKDDASLAAKENAPVPSRSRRAPDAAKPVEKPALNKPRTRSSLGKAESLPAPDPAVERPLKGLRGATAAAGPATALGGKPPVLRRAASAASAIPVVADVPVKRTGPAKRRLEVAEDVELVSYAATEPAPDDARVKRLRTSEPDHALPSVDELDVDEDADPDLAVLEAAKDEGWEDLDAGDEDDPLMVSEYVNEVYDYLRGLEVETMPDPNYMDHQPEVTWKMRGILIDWLVEVHGKFRLLPETMFLAVHLVDRFLSLRTIALVRFQLVGVTALFIAAKYEEIVCPSVQNFLYMTDGGYTDEEILKAERYMLQMLNFSLSYPNPLHFLRRISKADGYDVQSRTVAKMLLEISIVDRSFLATPPSMIAAAAAWLARKVLDRGPWGPNLVHYSGYAEAELLPAAQLMLDYVVRQVRLPEPEHPNFHKKYATRKYFRASELVASWAERRYRCTAKFGAVAAASVVLLEEHLDHAPAL